MCWCGSKYLRSIQSCCQIHLLKLPVLMLRACLHKTVRRKQCIRMHCAINSVRSPTKTPLVVSAKNREQTIKFWSICINVFTTLSRCELLPAMLRTARSVIGHRRPTLHQQISLVVYSSLVVIAFVYRWRALNTYNELEPSCQYVLVGHKSIAYFNFLKLQWFLCHAKVKFIIEWRILQTLFVAFYIRTGY